MKTYAYGFPRLGRKREYKKLIQSFWRGKVSEKELLSGLHSLEDNRIAVYQKYVDKFPCGEITLYDTMLDTAIMLGIYNCENFDQYYELCRGKNALEMTKWFNTNYHYLVPEIRSLPTVQQAKNSRDKFKRLQIKKSGISHIIGPFTFLKLSKGYSSSKFEQYFLQLAQLYKDLIKDFDCIHIDEPSFVGDVSKNEIELIKQVYAIIGQSKTGIFLFTYYDSVDFLKELYHLSIKGIGLDFVHGKENMDNIKQYGFPKDKVLIAGLVDGRNVWRTNINRAVHTLERLSAYAKRIMVSNACPLYHLPITIEGEQLDVELLDNLAFATERLYELDLIVQAYHGHTKAAQEWVKNSGSVFVSESNKSDSDSPQPSVERLDQIGKNQRRPSLFNKRGCPKGDSARSAYLAFGINENVRNRIKSLIQSDFVKPVSYQDRARIQKNILNLPLFPSTTIGSYPQTKQVRKMRADFRSGKVSKKEYKSFIREKIFDLILFQEDIGLDVLVHGEFERSDMVEFFAEKLNGITTTKNGWIISYGTRGYRPPIIYGDISRQEPMTVDEIAFAQTLTEKPVKGMLTGPVTIIAWSYARQDIPVYEIAYQIALVHQDEIKDYEKNGIKIAQIDEPAFREKAPLKKRNWDQYFAWATNSFRLASRCRPQTQIHTHMCYSEFGEIINSIIAMDFDVISIEASRSKSDILKDLSKINFDRQIGLGVWDIHSPAIPKPSKMKKVIKRALKVIPYQNIWVNPDCGLKTRKWKETITSLKNLVKTTKRLRKKYAP